MSNSDKIKILFLGDIFLGGDLIPYWYKNHNPFANLKELIEDHDIVYANVENSFFRGPQRPFRGGHLYAPPESISGLKSLKINVAGIANNHILDYGTKAMIQTKRLLNENGIKCTGTGLSIGDATTPVLLEVKNKRIGFLAFTTKAFYVNSVVASGFSVGSAPINEKIIKKCISDTRGDVDLLFVYFHWGYEFIHYPSSQQRKLAAKCISWGADSVIGSHPHVIQGFELIEKKPVFYSLGNFIFPEYYNLVGNKVLWNKENNQSVSASLSYNINDLKSPELQFEFHEYVHPEVLVLKGEERLALEKEFNKWSSVLPEYNAEQQPIKGVVEEINRRKKRWRRSFGKRFIRKYIYEVIKLVLGPFIIDKFKEEILTAKANKDSAKAHKVDYRP